MNKLAAEVPTEVFGKAVDTDLVAVVSCAATDQDLRQRQRFQAAGSTLLFAEASTLWVLGR